MLGAQEMLTLLKNAHIKILMSERYSQGSVRRHSECKFRIKIMFVFLSGNMTYLTIYPTYITSFIPHSSS